MEFISNPLWSVFGTMISIVAFVVTVIQRKKKSFACDFFTSTQLISVNDEIKDRIEILIDSKPTDDINLLIVRIINTGNQAITSTDYEVPITIEFNEDAELIEADIIRKSQEDLPATLETSKTTATIQPLLLNPSDYIVIKFLLTNYDELYTVTGRIIGVKEIQVRDLETATTTTVNYVKTALFIIIVGILFLSGAWVVTQFGLYFGYIPSDTFDMDRKMNTFISAMITLGWFGVTLGVGVALSSLVFKLCSTYKFERYS